ncbi:FAD-dependent monooxygenase [Brachybacterium horti]
MLDAIGNRVVPGGTTDDVNRSGSRRRPSMGYSDLPGDARMILRGDIESALHPQVSEVAEIRYGTTPVAVVEHADGVDVTLRSTVDGSTAETTERFDLLVGADGLRSTIIQEPAPGFTARDGLVIGEAGRSAWVFPFADHAPGALLSYRMDDVDAQFAMDRTEALRRAFGPEPLGPVLRHLLEQYDAAEDKLFDSVHQVVMPSWHADRVVLVGDAAWCLTLYSGMGASLGLAGADLLGTVLARNPGTTGRALREWEQQLRPFVEKQQLAGRTEGLTMFVPQNRRDLAKRAAMTTVTGNPVSKRAVRRIIASRFEEKSVDVAAP